MKKGIKVMKKKKLKKELKIYKEKVKQLRQIIDGFNRVITPDIVSEAALMQALTSVLAINAYKRLPIIMGDRIPGYEPDYLFQVGLALVMEDLISLDYRKADKETLLDYIGEIKCEFEVPEYFDLDTKEGIYDRNLLFLVRISFMEMIYWMYESYFQTFNNSGIKTMTTEYYGLVEVFETLAHLTDWGEFYEETIVLLRHLHPANLISVYNKYLQDSKTLCIEFDNGAGINFQLIYHEFLKIRGGDKAPLNYLLDNK